MAKHYYRKDYAKSVVQQAYKYYLPTGMEKSNNASTYVISFPWNKSPSKVGANTVNPHSPSPIVALTIRKGQYD